MLRDRGNMKWTAMMLPEHVKMLKEWGREEQTALPAEKAEWELEELQQVIERAARTKEAVQLTVWNSSARQDETGVITAVDLAGGVLLLETAAAVKRIAFSAVYAAQLADDCDD